MDGGAEERLLAQMAKPVEGLCRLFGPKAEAGVSPMKSTCRPAGSAGPPLHGAKGQTKPLLVKRDGEELFIIYVKARLGYHQRSQKSISSVKTPRPRIPSHILQTCQPRATYTTIITGR